MLGGMLCVLRCVLARLFVSRSDGAAVVAFVAIEQCGYRRGNKRRETRKKKQTHISCFLWAPLILPRPLKTRTDLVFYLYMQAPQGLGTREPSKVTNFFPRDDSHPQGPPRPGLLRESKPPQAPARLRLSTHRDLHRLSDDPQAFSETRICP